MSLYCKGENCPKSKDCLRAEGYRNYVKEYGIPKDGEDIGLWLVEERKCVDEGYTEGVIH